MLFGTYTDKVTIESYTTARDSAGGLVKTWSLFCAPYANIRFDRGSERTEGARDTFTESAVFKVRYDSDTKLITTSMRLVHGGYWDIESVLVLGRNDAIEIRAMRKDS